MIFSLHKTSKTNFAYFSFLCLYLLPVTLVNAQAVSIPIETKNTAMVLEANGNKDLRIIYFGKKLDDANEYKLVPSVYRQSEDYTGIANSAYTPSGSRNLFEPA